MHFSFNTCALDNVSHKILPNARSQRFALMFSSMSFIIVALTFRSTVDSELTFFCV